MRYYVTIGEATFEVVVSGSQVTIDGQAVNAVLTQVAGRHRVRHALVEGGRGREGQLLAGIGTQREAVELLQ